MVAPFSKCYNKIWVGFYLNARKHFFLEVSFKSKQKEHRFFQKAILGISKIAFRFKDRHVFMRQSMEIPNVFITLTLKQIFWKTKTFFQKAGVTFFS